MPDRGREEILATLGRVTAMSEAERKLATARILREAPAAIRRLDRYANERHAYVHRTLLPDLTKAERKQLTDDERHRHGQLNLSLWIALVVDQMPPLTPAQRADLAVLLRPGDASDEA